MTNVLNYLKIDLKEFAAKFTQDPVNEMLDTIIKSSQQNAQGSHFATIPLAGISTRVTSGVIPFRAYLSRKIDPLHINSNWLVECYIPNLIAKPFQVVDMKSSPARDYEDVLQYIIPCLQGLLEPTDNHILRFERCTWHSHAKSRLHSDSSRHQFDVAHRRPTASVFSKSASAPSSVLVPSAAPLTQKARKKTVKTEYNLDTYKSHAIPDVPACAREFGTTNGYSTMANFIRKLHIHVLERLGIEPADGMSFTKEERLEADIKEDMMYFHKVLRLNYTSYDRRRQQDIINPSTKRMEKTIL
ncbi:hypothetical protein BDZ89DRAFT_1131923 [Hymenopellis radicata]|nr:hypothetical protein BDZ89DRAFT_1131923 [Hymenopellis radicata]